MTKLPLSVLYTIAWVVSIPALFLSFLIGALILGAMSGLFGRPFAFAGCSLLMANIVFAWISLGVMTVNAIEQRQLARWWPLFGTVSGLICSVMVAFMRAGSALIFAIPAIIFAAHLVRYHLGLTNLPSGKR